MSTASAPLASCRRLRSDASCTSTSEPSTVAARAPGTPSGAPSHSVAPSLVDDARRVEHVTDAESVAQRAGEAERNEPPVGHAVRNAHADAGSR